MSADFQKEEERKQLKKAARRWAKRFRDKDLQDFVWYSGDVPEQLIALVESGRVRKGAALDVGCGPGVAVTYVAQQSFGPAVAFDIAPSAVRVARQAAEKEGLHPALAVAAAPYFPFRDASFSFVFDRGCLHVLDKAAWATYLDQVSRILVPDGWFQLIAMKDRIEPALLSTLVPAGLEPQTLEEFDMELNHELKGRNEARMLNWLFRKS